MVHLPLDLSTALDMTVCNILLTRISTSNVTVGLLGWLHSVLDGQTMSFAFNKKPSARISNLRFSSSKFANYLA